MTITTPTFKAGRDMLEYCNKTENLASLSIPNLKEAGIRMGVSDEVLESLAEAILASRHALSLTHNISRSERTVDGCSVEIISWNWVASLGAHAAGGAAVGVATIGLGYFISGPLALVSYGLQRGFEDQTTFRLNFVDGVYIGNQSIETYIASTKQAQQRREAEVKAKADAESARRETKTRADAAEGEILRLRRAINDLEEQIQSDRRHLASMAADSVARLNKIQTLLNEANAEIGRVSVKGATAGDKESALRTAAINIIRAKDLDIGGKKTSVIAECENLIKQAGNRQAMSILDYNKPTSQSDQAANLSSTTRSQANQTQSTVRTTAAPGLRGMISPTSTEFELGFQGIHPYFNEYTLDRTNDLIDIKLRKIDSHNSFLLKGHYNFTEDSNDLINIFADLKSVPVNIDNILIPISLYDKHAVGIMMKKQLDNRFKAFYIDPSNDPISAGLRSIFETNGYGIEQLPAQMQKGTNCAPEVIENFMLYLTGERLSQEEAIINNSTLTEKQLLQVSQPKVFTTYFDHAIKKIVTSTSKINSDVTEITQHTDYSKHDYSEVSKNTTKQQNDVELPQSVSVNKEISSSQIQDSSPMINKVENLYRLANELANEAWFAESNELAEEAAEKFTQALNLYAEVIELDPDNILYQKAFNIISLKLEGNDLFNEAIELAENAYNLESELSRKVGSAKGLLSLTNIDQNILTTRYKEVLELYRESQSKFCEALIISGDQRYQSCIDLVDSSIKAVDEYMDTNVLSISMTLSSCSNQIELFNNDTSFQDKDSLDREVLIGENTEEAHYAFSM